MSRHSYGFSLQEDGTRSPSGKGFPMLPSKPHPHPDLGSAIRNLEHQQ
jgi:hypothetical protein